MARREIIVGNYNVLEFQERLRKMRAKKIAREKPKAKVQDSLQLIKDKLEYNLKRRQLADVFVDTIENINKKHKSWKKLETEKISNFIPSSASFLDKSYIPNIKIIPGDCIASAKLLSKDGKTCMLNMASSTSRGGGVIRGAMAQEEELCRRSNLYFALKEEYYPWDKSDFVYTKNVKFFRHTDPYEYDDPFSVDIISVAAVNLNSSMTGITKYNKREYLRLMNIKVKQALQFPAMMGVKNLVLSAFGCGAFKNDPRIVSQLFKKHIKGLPYDNIWFAIFDDRNSKNNGISNLNSFQNTFKEYIQ